MPYPQFSEAKAALAGRLADPNNFFWSDTELGLYILESLRCWNALTEMWVVNFPFNSQPNTVWYNLGSLAGSPRLRTLTDTDLYNIIEYHLLEPATGATWTGTSQFSISDLSQALQRRRDEMIQMTACNLGFFGNIPSTPNVQRGAYPFDVLEPIRQRFIPAPTLGAAITLSREDTIAYDNFSPFHNQSVGLPTTFSVITEPPKQFDVDIGPNVPGSYDLVAVQQGSPFNPPGGVPLGVPDDWAWVIKWGALADLLGRDSEATDRERAAYCLRRYSDGLKIMQQANWIESATIQNFPVDTPSLREMDGYAPEWQDDPNAWQGIVTAGIDFIAPSPVGSQGASVNLVGNAPIPVQNNDPVQVMQDAYDTVLDYAQVLASFKMGGAEFKATMELEKKFYEYAQQNNKRLARLGIFSETVHMQGNRQIIMQERGY